MLFRLTALLHALKVAALLRCLESRNSNHRSLAILIASDFHRVLQGQVSAEGILHLVNPNLGSNSGMRIFEPRILGSNSGVEFFGPMFSNKKSPLKNSPPRNSPPKIHIKKFTPESGLKNSHCTSAGPFC